MQVHRDLDSLPCFTNAVVTIGTFDGVHLGHRQIIAQLRSVADACGGESVIITFDPHPRLVLQPGKGHIRLLTTLEEKIQLLGELGVDHLVVVPFTRSFSEMPAEAYVSDFLVQKFRPHTIIIGYDHHFGHNRAGNILLLRSMEARFGFKVIEIHEQLVRDLTVSSTRIRTYLTDGKVKLANDLLGYGYFVTGRVMHGDARGRELGFPTANLSFDQERKLIPAEGVYAAMVELPGDQDDPRSGHDTYEGAVNVGRLPTFGGAALRVEVFILDFDRDIYDRKIRVRFLEYIRQDQRFDSVDALVERMQVDVREVRDALAGLRGASM